MVLPRRSLLREIQNNQDWCDWRGAVRRPASQCETGNAHLACSIRCAAQDSYLIDYDEESRKLCRECGSRRRMEHVPFDPGISAYVRSGHAKYSPQRNDRQNQSCNGGKREVTSAKKACQHE